MKKIVFILVFYGFFVITDFMQKQKVKTKEKQMFNNALIE